MTGRDHSVLVIGLTGGIGVGKSTVAAMLGDLGAVVVDCDELGRLVVEPDGSAFGPLVEHFGQGIVDGDGRLDRAALAEIVFADPDALDQLNGITHPAMDVEIAARIAEAGQADADAVVVLDMAVLVESDLGKGLYDQVLVIEAPLDQRLERLTSTRPMTVEQAEARIRSQASDEERRAVADHVITNAGPLADLQAAVGEFWAEVVSIR